MVTIPVPFTNPEKELLEQQALQCETVLPKLIRIRSLMDETDIRQMQQTILDQQQKMEELRIKLSFFSESGKQTKTENRNYNEKSIERLFNWNQKQLEFLKEKFLESQDFKTTGCEMMPDGRRISNERDSMEIWEQMNPGHILNCMGNEMVQLLFTQIENRLVEHCGHREKEFEDDPLYDIFEGIHD